MKLSKTLHTVHLDQRIIPVGTTCEFSDETFDELHALGAVIAVEVETDDQPKFKRTTGRR